MRHCLLIIIFALSLPLHAEVEEFPAWYETTAALNVRADGSLSAPILTVLSQGAWVRVERLASPQWAMIKDSHGNIGYVSTDYITYVCPVDDTPEPVTSAETTKKKITLWGGIGTLLGWALKICLLLIVLLILRSIGEKTLAIISVIMYKLYWVACIPFYILNWLQRWASKPWRTLYKTNGGNDRKNAERRDMLDKAKIPLYIILTPLRLLNAVYYNLIVHCGFELYNYTVEIFVPSNDKEGADSSLLLILLMPWRAIKYVVWHGGLTLVESAVWTVVDTFVPALTLFHGTDAYCSVNITHAGRCGYRNDRTGIWNVGGGNYAGNGIYFAPVRSTALHYARCNSERALVVCRVSLGRVLDLGLAPWSVYRQCGRPNAFEATRWGLNNGYTTGEWWRGDAGWWEYCMYDWQNRYNHSWRIRPLYVLNLTDGVMQRIPGGMCHWLFRKMVIKDIIAYF